MSRIDEIKALVDEYGLIEKDLAKIDVLANNCLSDDFSYTVELSTEDMREDEEKELDNSELSDIVSSFSLTSYKTSLLNHRSKNTKEESICLSFESEVFLECLGIVARFKLNKRESIIKKLKQMNIEV